MNSENEIEKDPIMFERICEVVAEAAVSARLADPSKSLFQHSLDIAEKLYREAAENERYEEANAYAQYAADVKRDLMI